MNRETENKRYHTMEEEDKNENQYQKEDLADDKIIVNENQVNLNDIENEDARQPIRNDQDMNEEPFRRSINSRNRSDNSNQKNNNDFIMNDDGIRMIQEAERQNCELDNALLIGNNFSGQILHQNMLKPNSSIAFSEKFKQYDPRRILYTQRKGQKNAIKAVLPNEPYLKLTILRNNTDIHTPLEYIVTPRGMLNSNRNTDHDDIVIGRQQYTGDGIIPNDICLLYSDRAISRIHCKIITKYGFKVRREIPENFLAFLMMSHNRLGAQSYGRNLPLGLNWHIFSFIKEPRKFWLTDLGSVFGTYVRIKPSLNYALEKGQTYLIGADTQINIVEVSNIPSNRSIQAQKDTYIELEKSRKNDDFFKFLAREKLHNKYELHGLEEFELDLVKSIMSNEQELLDEDSILNETERNVPKFDRPYLRIEIQNGAQQAPNHLFVGDITKELLFVIGRLQECDININQNTISRRQCRFICENGIWYIADGANKKESANGTWISLTDYRFKRERMESEPRAIDNLTEIKISDTIMRVEIFRNDQKEKPKKVIYAYYMLTTWSLPPFQSNPCYKKIDIEKIHDAYAKQAFKKTQHYCAIQQTNQETVDLIINSVLYSSLLIIISSSWI